MCYNVNMDVLRVDTDKGPLIKGNIAFMDGRDPDAKPPLTVMNVNIWNGVARTRIVCQLGHGRQVDILDITLCEPEARYYFLVKSNDCQGWIPGVFLSNRRNKPIGDRI